MNNAWKSWRGPIWPLRLLGITFFFVLGTIWILNFDRGSDPVFAEENDMQKARDTFPNIVDTRLDSCNLCHTGTEWGLNDYGRDYKDQGKNLTAINSWDSDNDGFNNITEINALTFPGDPSDFPQAATQTPTPTMTPTPTATPTATSTPSPTPDQQTNMAIKKQASNIVPLPGESVTFTLTILNLGNHTTTGITVADMIPAAVLAPTWSHSTTLDGITARAGESFIWDLPEMAPGVQGIITISGQLDPSLPKGSTVVNQAAVSSSEEDGDISDNEDKVTIIVGGQKQYMPVIMGK